MSPEEFMGLPYDAKKHDVWAAAIVWFAIRFGNMPWLIANPDESEQFHYFVHHGMDQGGKIAKLPAAQSDLMLKMLHLDPTKRISAKEILSHPWFIEFSRLDQC